MSSVNTQWFKDRLEESNISQRKLAAMIGVDQASVSLMFHGKRRISMAEAASISTILGVALEDIFFHAGMPKPVESNVIPLSNIVAGNGAVQEPRSKSATVPLPRDLPPTAQALRLEDPLSWYDGWVFYVVPKDNVPPEAIGRMCVVETLEREQILGFVRKGYTQGCFTLAKLDDTVDTDIRLHSASPVLWIAC